MKSQNMESTTMKTTQLIVDAYTSYHHSVCHYISFKIGNEEEAEDLSQDVFLRLIDYKEMLRPDTVKCFIFTIARNLVYDYLRRRYKMQEITSYIYYEQTVTYTNETESQIMANDLLAREREKINSLSPQRGKVYAMNRFGNQSISDISRKLSLSRRTVENHLFVSRKEVREYIRKCM